MLKQDTYLINIARAPFKLSNLKQPFYYKLWQFYYQLRQCVITNYGSFITNHGKHLLQITTKNYYKLRKVLLQNLPQVLLQILHIAAVSSIITNYGKFNCKLRQVLQITTLLQITS